MITPEMQEVLDDLSTSEWLKGAIRHLATNVDPVDAFHWSELLAKLMRQRCDIALGWERDGVNVLRGNGQ